MTPEFVGRVWAQALSGRAAIIAVTVCLIFCMPGCALLDGLNGSSEDGNKNTADASSLDATDDDAESRDASELDAADVDAPDGDAPDVDAPDVDAPDGDGAGDANLPDITYDVSDTEDGGAAPTIDSFVVTSSGFDVTLRASATGVPPYGITIDWDDETVINAGVEDFSNIEASHTYSDAFWGQDLTITLTVIDATNQPVGDAYTLRLSVPQEGLAGEWLFNGSLDDTSGNGRNAQSAKGALVSQGSNGCLRLTPDRHNNAGNAIELNNSSGGAGCGNEMLGVIKLPALDLVSEFTVSMWLVAENQDNIFLYKKGYTNQDNWLYFYSGEAPLTDTHGHEIFALQTSSTVEAMGGQDPRDKGWLHYAMRVSTSGSTTSTELYRNGAVVGGGSGEGTTSEPPSTFWLVGGISDQPNNPVLQGKVDDIRIYDRALSPGEIRALAAE